jgi:hypothetical protein
MIKVEHRILAPTIVLILFISSSLIVKASETETIMPIADTYVDLLAVDSAPGQEEHLEVAEYPPQYFSITFLMFDISHIINAPFEVKLRLFCYYVDSPHVVGVHWCVNNTWNEENLTRVTFSGFKRTAVEDYVRVDSIAVWYEWKVTNFVSEAMEEDYEKITLTLEVLDPLEGIARSRFASKDQDMPKYTPQLVFTYLEPKADSLDPIILVASGLAVIVAVALIAYKFSRRTPRKTRHRKARPK